MVAKTTDRSVMMSLSWVPGAKRWDVIARITEPGVRDLVKVFRIDSAHEVGPGQLAALVGALEREMNAWLF